MIFYQKETGKIELVARPDGDCECDGTQTGFGQRASLIFCAIHRNNGFLLKKPQVLGL